MCVRMIILTFKMEHMYTKQELTYVALIYGEVNQNAAATFRLYAQRFTNRILPAPRRFVNVVLRLRDTGCVKERQCHDGSPRRSLHVLNAEVEVLETVE